LRGADKELAFADIGDCIVIGNAAVDVCERIFPRGIYDKRSIGECTVDRCVGDDGGSSNGIASVETAVGGIAVGITIKLLI